MADIPMEVLLQGPAAVAAWLDAEESASHGRMNTMANGHLEAFNDRLAQNLTEENLVAMMGSCAMFMALVSLTEAGGMRGPARDELAVIIDAGFEAIEDLPAELRQKMEAIAKRANR